MLEGKLFAAGEPFRTAQRDRSRHGIFLRRWDGGPGYTSDLRLPTMRLTTAKFYQKRERWSPATTIPTLGTLKSFFPNRSKSSTRVVPPTRKKSRHSPSFAADDDWRFFCSWRLARARIS